MSKKLDVDDLINWLNQSEDEAKATVAESGETADPFYDGVLSAIFQIREYIKKMRKIDEAEGKEDQSWIPCSERFPDGDRYVLVSFENLHCQILHDIKEMMRVERSIREMMKNPIQAMDYLSMPGCHYLSRTKERRKSKMRLIDADVLTKNVTKLLNADPNADRMVDIDDIAASVLMEIEEQPTVPLWISVEDKVPEDIDRRFFMCLVENHLKDPPMMCQYEEEYGFGFWKDIYDPVTLGFVDSEFETMEDLKYEKVLYWMPMIEPPEEAMQDD